MGRGGRKRGERSCGGGCINREGGTCILGWVRGGRSAQRKWKVCSAGRPGPGIRVRTCRAGGAGGPPRRARCFFFFPCKRGGGCCWYRPLLLLPPGVKVQEEVQPLPSFLRSEHTEAGAAAPPLHRRLRPAQGRAHPAAAAARSLQRSPLLPPARLRDQARAAAPVRAPPPPPSPFVSSAPAPPPRLALCRGRSARPQRAREKPRRARARLRGRPPPPPPRARAPLLVARRRRLAGGRGGGRRVCRRGAPLCSRTPRR